MKTHTSPYLTLAHAFEQFLEGSSFARRTRESYAEDLAPLLAERGQKPIAALTTDILHAFLARQESLAPATYQSALGRAAKFYPMASPSGMVVLLVTSVEPISQ